MKTVNARGPTSKENWARSLEATEKEQPVTDKQIEQLAINTIRTLSIDAIQQARSGHPGTPMAMAPVMYCLWQRFLRFDPEDPIWPNRDRFVLSAGHASMLRYSMLYLTGVKAVDPDYEIVGQPSEGVATSVGMAIANKWLQTNEDLMIARHTYGLIFSSQYEGGHA